ncbi:GyrI-like small molecule binding domain [Phytophthora infestans]|uniref:GyrI-like small molecule binding domain n=1 Tax=Phytophthora infestans TaxID=4787 RepID=A0A833S789_PHYIN|nr:GyrI-like small molecule binding domain [Phytophthora infestans]
MSECEAAAAAIEAAGEAPRAQTTLWDQVLAFSRAHGLEIAGPCFIIYYDQGYKEKDVDAEVCLVIGKDVQVDGTAASTSLISVRTLPAVPRAASLVHLGSYDALNPCYRQLYEWIDKENLRPNAPVREVYLRMDIEDVSEVVRDGDPAACSLKTDSDPSQGPTCIKHSNVRRSS